MRSAFSLLKLGVDLDGVLNHLTDECLAAFKRRGLIPDDTTRDAVTSYWFEECFPSVTKEVCWELFRDGAVFEDALPNVTAQLVLERIHRAGVEVHIVTSRDLSAWHRLMTYHWLRRYDMPYDVLAICPKGRKVEYAREHGLHVFVEDYLPEAEAMANAGLVSFLLDQPYNKSLKPVPNLRRVYTWGEVGTFFGV